MEKSTVKKALLLNFCIFILEVFATCWMMSGITITETAGTLTAERFAMFKYFTVDSNVIMGIIALIIAIEHLMILKGKKNEVSTCSYIFALMGTAGVTLTMLVTVFFLTPTMAAEYGWFSCFKNSNFFLHLLNPTVSIVAFLAFEKTNKIRYAHTWTSLAPLLIYTVYYVAQNLAHAENGVIQKAYDWYGFFLVGTKSIIIVLPIIILVAYAISFGLWKLNKPKSVEK